MDITKNFIIIAILLNLGMLFFSIYGMVINYNISQPKFVASLIAALIFSSFLWVLFFKKDKNKV